MKSLFTGKNLLKSFTVLSIAFLSFFGTEAKAQSLDLGKLDVLKPALPEVRDFRLTIPVELDENEDLSEKFFNNLLDKATTLLGIPYKWGGSTKRAFDCSGFTAYVFKQFGITLPRSSRDQARNGENIAKNDLRPGDLIFFNGRRGVGSKSIGHVGIVVANNGNDDIKFIHSANGGVQISSLKEDVYYKKRFVSAKRITPSPEVIKDKVS
ncbi:MAG: C40 family peptidase [Bacteroidales bacterium]